jgi:hypothetical protein
VTRRPSVASTAFAARAEPARHLARHGEQPRLERVGAIQEEGLIELHRGEGRLEHAEGCIVVEQRVPDPGRGDDAMRQRLAQHEQAEHVIDVGVADDDGVEGYVPGAGARPEPRRACELIAHVGARVHQRPARAVGGERERGLRAGRHRGIAGARARAVRAAAVPLRQATARGGAQHAHPHAPAFASATRSASPPSSASTWNAAASSAP